MVKNNVLFAYILFFLAFVAIAAEVTKEVKIIYFFPRDGIENGSGNPNWFYYWNQFIPKGRIGILIYDNTISGYASTDPVARRVRVSQIASEYNDETTHRGIHTFYETLAHENHHIILWEGWWPTGYNSSQDTDGDLYPDNWERNDPEAIAYGFAVPDPSDAYNVPNSAGYRYEEDKCRVIEHAINEIAYDGQDWSYDHSGINQGKMWLKLP